MAARGSRLVGFVLLATLALRPTVAAAEPAPTGAAPGVAASGPAPGPMLEPLLASGPLGPSSPTPVLEPGGDLDLVGQLLRTLFSLAFVVGLIYLLARFGLRRLTGLRGLTGPQRDLKMLERLPLDARHSLYVVSYRERRVFLLGSGEGGVRFLSELSEAPPPGKTFQQALDKVAATPPPASSEGTHA